MESKGAVFLSPLREYRSQPTYKGWKGKLLRGTTGFLNVFPAYLQGMEREARCPYCGARVLRSQPTYKGWKGHTYPQARSYAVSFPAYLQGMESRYMRARK